MMSNNNKLEIVLRRACRNTCNTSERRGKEKNSSPHILVIKISFRCIHRKSQDVAVYAAENFSNEKDESLGLKLIITRFEQRIREVSY